MFMTLATSQCQRPESAPRPSRGHSPRRRSSPIQARGTPESALGVGHDDNALSVAPIELERDAAAGPPVVATMRGLRGPSAGRPPRPAARRLRGTR